MPFSRAVLLIAATAPAALGADPRAYVVDPAASRILVHVGKSGVFGFAGHEHEVKVGALRGAVTTDGADPASASVEVTIDAGALEVTGRGEPAQDAAQVQEKMRGPDVLDASRFATIAYKSTTVAARKLPDGAWDATIAGVLTLHGVTRPLTLPLRVTIEGDTLNAAGRVELRQSDFGIHPVSAGGGTVKVKNEIAIEIAVVARAGAGAAR